MARTVKTHVVTKQNRDHGKTFIITEMAPRRAHSWATKAIFAVMNSGVDIPDDVMSMGLAGIAVIGLGALTNIPHAVAEPLLDEMLSCAQIKQALVTRDLVEEDVEEAITLFELQQIAISMHIEPFISGDNQNSELSPTTPAAAG